MPLATTNLYQLGDGNPVHVIGQSQGAPSAYVASTTLLVTDVANDLITMNNAGATALTLPLATDVETYLAAAPLNFSFDINIINLGAGTTTLTTNTGWTLVGNMAVLTGIASHFRLRKVAQGAWTAYQIA